jgi:DNA-binding SARP family transcriptional activator
MSATELAIDAELACGRHQPLVGELSALTAEHPYQERLAGQLMLALYRCDRSADALDAYHRLRDRLAGELGVDPGPELSGLYTAILRRDSQIAGPATTRVAVPDERPCGVPDKAR